MAKNTNFEDMAKDLLPLLGGADNISDLVHCITRLRFTLRDESLVQLEAIKKIDGVIDVVIVNGQYQIVIGTQVAKAYDAILPYLNIQTQTVDQNTDTSKPAKKESFLQIVAGIFAPVLGAFTAVGILKGFLVMFINLGWMSTESGTYVVIYAIADAFFYFLPIALAITSARKFGTNEFVAFVLGGTLLYPSLIEALASEGGLKFIGFPVTNVTYSSSVLPSIIAVFLLAKLEKLIKKVMPEIVSDLLTPLICLLIMAPVTLLLIGPATIWVGDIVAAGYTALYNFNRPIASAIIGGLWPLLIMIGAHWGLIPIAVNNIAVNGYDTLLPSTNGTNFAIAGAVLAIALKAKKPETKELGISTGISALIGGITEPAIYGLVLKHKKTLISCLISIAIGGLFVGFAGTQQPGPITASIITIPALASVTNGWGNLAAAVIGFVGAFLGTLFFGFDESKE